MNEYKKWLPEFMTRINFPKEAQEVFMNAFECLKDEEEFAELLKSYEKDFDLPYYDMLSQIGALGAKYEIHEYTSGLLMFLCFARILLERYHEAGIDEAIYWSSMMDLRYKLEECRLVMGKVGSFVCWWFPRFFRLQRFGLGRLQFEVKTLPNDYVVDGIALPKDHKAINVHIPRTETPLNHSEVEKSYDMAAEIFGDEFEGGPIVFMCHSWMLDPWLHTVLPPQSNIVQFSKDFNIVESGKDDGYYQLWRVFDCFVGDPKLLPRDTTLRRAYAELVDKGEQISQGFGVFVYKK